MNKSQLTLLLFLSLSQIAFAQSDTLLSKMPIVNGRLVYSDSVKVVGRNKIELDSVAKKWFGGYFVYHRPDTLLKDQDAGSSVLSKDAFVFRMSTSSVGLLKYDFFLIMTIKINCYDGCYKYKIFDIFFVPKSNLFRIGGYYKTSPEYLIGLLSKKHLGLGPWMNMGRKKITEYLVNTNSPIQACITSLNKAMANE